jgi:hypothetical protein
LKIFEFKKREKQKQKHTREDRYKKKKRDEIFEIVPLRLRVVFDAFPVPFRLLFPTKGSSSHIKSISKSSSRLSSFFCIAFATLFLLVPARGKVVFFFFFVVASFFSPAKHLGDEDASTTILAVILDGLESGISGVLEAFLLFLSSCSFSLVLFVLVRSFNLLLLLFFVVVAVVRRIFREDILKMFLKNDFQTNCSRIKESPSECTRGREEEKRVSYILLLVVEVYRVFAKRRRTGVVRLFCVLVSLVFVGGGCVDMKVRKLSLAFFAALFEKKILHVKI